MTQVTISLVPVCLALLALGLTVLCAAGVMLALRRRREQRAEVAARAHERWAAFRGQAVEKTQMLELSYLRSAGVV